MRQRSAYTSTGGRVKKRKSSSLFEPAEMLNTGTVESQRTVRELPP